MSQEVTFFHCCNPECVRRFRLLIEIFGSKSQKRLEKQQKVFYTCGVPIHKQSLEILRGCRATRDERLPPALANLLPNSTDLLPTTWVGVCLAPVWVLPSNFLALMLMRPCRPGKPSQRTPAAAHAETQVSTLDKIYKVIGPRRPLGRVENLYIAPIST